MASNYQPSLDRSSPVYEREYRGAASWQNPCSPARDHIRDNASVAEKYGPCQTRSMYMQSDVPCHHMWCLDTIPLEGKANCVSPGHIETCSITVGVCLKPVMLSRVSCYSPLGPETLLLNFRSWFSYWLQLGGLSNHSKAPWTSPPLRVSAWMLRSNS